MKVYPATLGNRERLVTYGVGYGVGIGVPLVLAVGFATAFDEPSVLLFTMPFIAALGTAWFFRPVGFGVTTESLSVLRPAGPKRIPLSRVTDVVSPATRPDGFSIGLARVEGFHGTFGLYWSRDWGRYRVHVTNADHAVEIRLEGGSRVIISPDDPQGFLRAVRHAIEVTGAQINVHEGP
jgi:hypothetical protein